MSSISSILGDSSGQLTSDTLIPLSTLETPYDGYSGRVAIYETVTSTSPFNIDLIVQSVSYSINENIQLEEHIGNLFSVLPLGMGYMQLSVNGMIPDPGNNYGKDKFMDYYRNYLRAEAVARRGKMPVYMFPHMAVFASAINVVFTETGSVEDLVYLSLTLAVTKIIITDGKSNNVSIDYFHGINREEGMPNNTSSDVLSSGQLSSSGSTTSPSVTTK